MEPNKLVPDGEGDYERHCNDADYLAPRFMRGQKAKGQTVATATFTSGGTDDIKISTRIGKS